MFAKPNALLRLEGLVLFLLAIAVYRHESYGWTLFWSTILAPDISMLGYLAGPKIGAVCYNIAHSKLLPGALALAGLFSGNPLLPSLSLVWFAHIGFDRMLGYGLKYPEGFKATHLGLIGQAAGRFLPCGG